LHQSLFGQVERSKVTIEIPAKKLKKGFWPVDVAMLENQPLVTGIIPFAAAALFRGACSYGEGGWRELARSRKMSPGAGERNRSDINPSVDVTEEGPGLVTRLRARRSMAFATVIARAKQLEPNRSGLQSFEMLISDFLARIADTVKTALGFCEAKPEAID
jgi:hypothetical protein